MTRHGGHRADEPWAGFVRALILAALAAFGLLYGTVLVADPYGIRAGPGRAPSPLMDLNGRTMYPQLARGGRFDGAVFGTSTVRLLDPQVLGDLFGGRVANLGPNAGTPWEQVQLARLFLRHVPEPRLVVLGLDRNWCEPDADAPEKRLTFRDNPPWLYDEDGLNDLPPLLSLTALEIAGRVLLHRLGLMPARIRGDGYEVFTPPEDRYDLARARVHIASSLRSRGMPGPSVRLGEPRLPALDWLRDLLAALPRGTRLVAVLPPIHVAAQPADGSPDAADDLRCKAEIAGIVGGRGGTVADFRLASAVTTADTNYWDPLHYRQPIARLFALAIAGAAAGQASPDGFYRLLSGGR